MAAPARAIPDSAFEVSSNAKLTEPPVELPPPDAEPSASEPDDSSQIEPDQPSAPVKADASQAGKDLAGRKKSLQARIDELTREKADHAREAENIRKEATRLRIKLDALQQAAPKAEPAKPEPKANGQPQTYSGQPKPQLSDFTDWNDYNEAVTDWKIAERDAKNRIEQQRHAHQQQTQTALATFLQNGVKAHPDFETKLQTLEAAGVQWPPAVVHFLLTHPSGPEIAYQLASAPDEAARFATLSDPVTAGVELGKLLARQEGAHSGPSPGATLSQAKPPIKPVGGAPVASDAITDDLSFEEHFKRMNARDRDLRKQGIRR